MGKAWNAGRSVIAAVLLLAPGLAAADPAPRAKSFAQVGDSVISREQYEAAVAAGVRQKFYHARPPERELEDYRREVGERLIERELLLAEAGRRGIGPDRERIQATVAEYDKRYGSSERWKSGRAQMLPPLIAELERQSMLEQLERLVRKVPQPDEPQARAYYERHKEQFTEPEQVRLSLILLKVDPSSPRAAWEKAQDEAAKLRERLGRGADFAELARMQSADASAEKGGDLGYLHRGMLPDAIQSGVVDALRPGDASAPVRLLEGFALIRLDDRKLARERSFEDVRARATELAHREREEEARKVLLSQLRARAAVSVDETAYRALPEK